MNETHQHEIEVKILLEHKAAADRFVEKLKAIDPRTTLLAETKQRNHYFHPDGDTKKLGSALSSLLTPDQQKNLSHLFSLAKTFSLRTRYEDGTVTLVVKASQDANHDHGLSRLEGEYVVKTNNIERLDGAIQSAGFTYLSKWSRHRKTYRYKDYTVCLDNNAGYGYLAEIEKIVHDPDEIPTTRKRVVEEIAILGEQELPADRLTRMFAYYNTHWHEYYQTDKTFTIL